MFKFVTRIFRKRSDNNAPEYRLPSDDPELNPILVEDDGEDLAVHEVAALNSQLLARVNPLDPAGMSVRTRAIVEMKNGLGDLASHIRTLGQRLHAQSMGQSKLIEALSALPQTIKEVIPNGEAQTNALAAMKLALDDQTAANRQFVEALKPLPDFVAAAANLPETARKQMWALNELTKQLEEGNRATKEQGDQVKVMVETLSAGNTEQKAEISATLEQLANLQKTQLKHTVLAVKSNELARQSQRKHQSELLRANQSRLTAIHRDQVTHLGRIEEHFKASSRRQMVLAGVAAGLAVGALVLTALVATGVVKLPGGDSAPAVAQPERVVDKDAVVGK
jgi:chromosome segregation ATPase